MLWRKGNKPSFARPNNKVWVHVHVFPNVVVSLPPPTLPVSKKTSSPSNDVQPNHSGVLRLSFTIFLATEITKKGWFSFLFLCLKVSFLLFFSPSIRPIIGLCAFVDV
jgi:hypothetical protein